MQIGEVVIGPRSAFQRLHIRAELNEIAGHKARRQTELTQNLHEQPRSVAARTGAAGERLFGRLYARLPSNEIADGLLQALIELNQKIDSVVRLARYRLHEFFQKWPGRFR